MQHLAPATVVNQRYQISDLIGEGSAGQVYAAIDLRLNTRVAVKQITRISARRRRAFEREARILARLRHPGLPVVSDYFSDEQGAFLVMDQIDGVDLATLIEQRGLPISEERTLQIADQLLQTLEYLHGQHPPIIHRGIKPHDIKLTPDGRVVLLDFGLASEESAGMPTGSTVNPYNPALWYAAPELLYRRPSDARSDLYALGATLAFLLTGKRPPGTGERVNALIVQHADPLDLVALQGRTPISEDLRMLIDRMLTLNPDERIDSATAVRRALRTTRTGRQLWPPPPPRPAEPPQRPAPPPRSAPPAVTGQPAGADPNRTRRLADPPPQFPPALVATLLIAGIILAGLLLWMSNW